MSKGLSVKAAFDLYQLCGELFMLRDRLTEGQRERLETLVLDVLSEPSRYTAKTIRDLREQAKKP